MTRVLHNGVIQRGMDSVVVYGRGKRIKENSIHYVCGELCGKVNHLVSRVTGLMYGGCPFSTSKVISIIKRQKPDVVHLQCINGYFVNIYRLVEWLKLSGIPTVLTLHAEFMYTANCPHALDCEKWKTGCVDCRRVKKETESIFFNNTSLSYKKMLKAFEGFGDKLRVVSVSDWLMNRAKQSPILKDMHHSCIYNSVDTTVFRRYEEDELKKRFCPNGEKLVFHATASFSDAEDHFKGGEWILKLAQRMRNQNVVFVVAGNSSVSTKVPDNVILLGRVSDQHKLAKLYAISDVTLLVSKKETFSMVVPESLCCGTPVVGFEAGAPEQIAIKDYSLFYPQKDLSGLQSGVESFLAKDFDKDAISNKAISIYSTEKMVEDYISVYRSFQ